MGAGMAGCGCGSACLVPASKPVPGLKVCIYCGVQVQVYTEVPPGLPTTIPMQLMCALAIQIKETHEKCLQVSDPGCGLLPAGSGRVRKI